MEIELKTFLQNDVFTLGTLGLLNENPYWFTIERPLHEKRIRGKSAIYAGRYELIKRERSPKVDEYKKKYGGWFKYHIELKDVPDADHILIHVANYVKDIEGCIGIGYGCDLTNRMITRSAPAFKEFALMLYSAFDKGERNFITIRRFV